MKIEELTQDKLDEILASVEAMQESQKALKADLAKAKAKAKGADIDPEAHAELQTKVEELSGALAKAEKASKTQIDGLSKQLSEKDGALSQYLIDANLTDSLVKANVKPEFMDASKALLKAQATIKADNGSYSALIGDKPIADAVKEWAAGDQGKHFVKAPENNGGGSNGGNGGASSKQVTRSHFDGMSHADRASFAHDGGKVIDG